MGNVTNQSAAAITHTEPRHYYEGQVITCDGLKIILTRQSHRPLELLVTPRVPMTYIEIGSELDLESPEVTRRISALICRIAQRVAEQMLLPLAHSVARRVGAAPAGWKISRGHRRLGYCDWRGVIALSSMLVFLPTELREFVICHELAHLSEMNHGREFHKLCNHYCGGRERQLISALRASKWPLMAE